MAVNYEVKKITELAEDSTVTDTDLFAVGNDGSATLRKLSFTTLFTTIRTRLESIFLKLSGGTVTGTLVLSKTQDASGIADNSPALVVGGTRTTAHMEMDCNEVLAKSDGTTPTTLNLNTDGGAVALGAGMTAKGNISTTASGGVNVTATSSTTGNTVYLYSYTDGTHGIYSNGYGADSANHTAGSKWLVYRNASGNITLNGNAATATTATSANKLTTARAIKIGNKSLNFDGTAALTYTLADIGATAAETANKLATARAIKIGNKSLNFDGSAAITYTLADIGAADRSIVGAVSSLVSQSSERVTIGASEANTYKKIGDAGLTISAGTYLLIAHFQIKSNVASTTITAGFSTSAPSGGLYKHTLKPAADNSTGDRYGTILFPATLSEQATYYAWVASTSASVTATCWKWIYAIRLK